MTVKASDMGMNLHYGVHSAVTNSTITNQGAHYINQAYPAVSTHDEVLELKTHLSYLEEVITNLEARLELLEDK